MWVAFPSVKKDIHQVRSRVLQNKNLVEYIPEDTGRKLNVHKTFRRRLGRLLKVLCTLNLRPVSTGQCKFLEFYFIF